MEKKKSENGVIDWFVKVAIIFLGVLGVIALFFGLMIFGMLFIATLLSPFIFLSLLLISGISAAIWEIIEGS